MKHKKDRGAISLKYKLLIWLIPIVIIYTFVLAWINSSYILSTTKDTLEKTLSETAKITSDNIANNIAHSTNLTTLLANRVLEFEDEITMPYSRLDVADFEARVASLGESYGFLNMMIADMDGYTRTANHTNLVEVQAEYYSAIINEGKTIYVSDVTLDKGKFAGRYVLNYSAPVYGNDGTLIGVLICKADAAELSALVSGISVGEEGSTFIMDSTGQCIAHQDEQMLFSGSAYTEYRGNAEYSSLNELWSAMERQESGYMPYDFKGARIAAFCAIPGTKNWTVAVTVSESEFFRGAVAARVTAAWIAFGMIIFVSGVLMLLFHRVTQSIGRITKRLEDLSAGDLKTEVKIDASSDETLRLSQAAATLSEMIQILIFDTENTLSEIAGGNLLITPNAEYPGDFTAIKLAIESNLAKLNEIIQSIARTSEEVARGSSQMAAGASGLAQGATEQASSLEELFETVSSLAERTYEIGGIDKRRLAEISELEDSDAATDEADEAKLQAADTMAEKLTIAIKKIAEASASIRRIASDIEAISSETGMLALNASVEATHAGDYGRGFSVIASEIRALADKSRESAKDADDKIDSISKAVDRGTQIVDITISTIGEMTLAMNQVKATLEQVSNIVENIAATAEETAAGSEELSAQADYLKNLVAEFKYHAD